MGWPYSIKMTKEETLYLSITDKFTNADPLVQIGKMMSAPALKYNDKVFLFFHKTEMGFRLGPNFDAIKFGLLNPKPLSPFKSKPPLKGWVIVTHEESNQWDMLSTLALEFTKTI